MSKKTKYYQVVGGKVTATYQDKQVAKETAKVLSLADDSVFTVNEIKTQEVYSKGKRLK